MKLLFKGTPFQSTMVVIFVGRISMVNQVFQNPRVILFTSTICQQEALSLGACTNVEQMVVRITTMVDGLDPPPPEVFP